MNALTIDRIHPAARVVAKLAHHLGRRERNGLIRPARGCGVESVGDRDDLAEHAHLPLADRARISGKVALHVVLVRHDHRAIRKLLRAADLEQRQHAEPRVRGDRARHSSSVRPIVLLRIDCGTRDLPMS